MKNSIKKIELNFRNIETIEVDENTSFYEISKLFKSHFAYPIMGVKFNNETIGLDKLVTKKGNIDFYDLSTPEGNTIYSHSVHFLMIVAIKRLLGNNINVIIQNSIDNGVYCEVVGMPITKKIVSEIQKEMDKMVQEDLKFINMSVRRTEAIKHFKHLKQYDKANVLKYISNSHVTLYRLDNVYDYFFSTLVYSTKVLKDYKLTYVNENGFVLSVPTIFIPEYTADYKHVPLVFNTFNNYAKWGKMIGIENASDLNKFVCNGEYNKMIRLSELNYEKQLMEVSNKIFLKKKDVKLVLIAGPSSSGKTTSAKKLCNYLEGVGFHTHLISTDDYFKEREETPKDSNGEYDFECLDAIDLDLFNKHLTKLLDGEKVLIPKFNFVKGHKEYDKNYLKLEKDDIIVIEGLHCLNEDLTLSVPRKNKFKIFIGPFTQLNIDDHNRIHTSDTRRLRRIIRDNRHRGYKASDTLKMWHKIKLGESKYIYPFQNDSDAVINSALTYELGVLKVYAEPLLYAVKEDDPTYPEAIRLINFLRNFLPIPSDEVPRDSVLREFIGGSGFEQ